MELNIWQKERLNSSVIVNNASRKNGTNHILKNLNMNVKKGSIYALLGSSGCGKTTLLSCIVGIRKLDEGEIQVLGQNSPKTGNLGNRIGFMPQEIALFGEFTIQEAMNYFGKIAGMNKDAIKERMKFLIKLLDLPNDISRYVRNMSGGQQRRLSLAVALIHQPELLILDEPTVGIDPILRECIWEHLIQITLKKKTTVIITTHYLEEASHANTLGIMRSGKILIEESPENLFEKYKMTLEKIVLHFCHKDSANEEESKLFSNSEESTKSPIILSIKNIEDFPPTNGPYNYTCSRKSSIISAVKSSKNRISALVRKNLLCLWRNLGFLAFLFCLPSIQLGLFSTTVGGDLKDINFGVINHELGMAECETPYSCIFSNLSCNFLQALPDDLKLKTFGSESEALMEIDKGNIWGYISFPQNYSRNLVEVLISSGVTLDNETLTQSRPIIKMDTTSLQIYYFVKKTLFDSFINFTKAMLDDCELESTVGDEPLKYEEPAYGLEDPNMVEFIIPPAYLTLIFFMAITLTCQVLILEKKEGMFERTLVAGVTYFESIISHMIAQFIIMLGQIALGFLILYCVFQYNFIGPAHYILLLAILQGICGMLLGFILALICKEERDVMQLAIAFVFPNFLLSGVIWPPEGMPQILKSTVWLLPQTLACESMRSMFSRGWEIEHPLVYAGFIATVLWIILLTMLIYVLILIVKRK